MSNDRARCLKALILISLIVSSATVFAQSPAAGTDYGRLAEPTVAKALLLTDAQQTSVATILKERDTAVSAATSDAQKTAARDTATKKLTELLTDEQQQKFTTLFGSPKIRFNFRLQKWPDVLDYIASEAGLSLVSDDPPPGVFNYSDSKDYTPTEAIDLVNGWLLTRGYTLVRRERLLMCVNLKDGLPDASIPRITTDDLKTRGRFEFVTVLIPLEGRLSATVLSEIKPLLGTYGKAEALEATKQILVTDAAGTVRSVADVIKQVPLPSKPKPKPPAPKPPAKPAPKPELQIYPTTHANPKQAGEVLNKFISGTILVDEKANQISINAVPAEHAKVKVILEQLESNQGPDKQPQLKLYPVRVSDPDEMIATLKLVSPDAQYRYDTASRQLVALAAPNDHERIRLSIEKIATQRQTGPTNLNVYPLEKVDADAALELVANLLPDARVSIDSKTKSLIAIGSREDHAAIVSLLEQLQPRLDALQPSQLKSYTVESEIAASAVEVLPTVVPEASVTNDLENKRLLVVAPPDKHAVIDSTLKQLTENLQRPDQSLKSFDARQVDATSVTSLLTTLAPQAMVTNDTANQRLLVIGSDKDHAAVQNVIDQVSLADNDAALKSYPLDPNVDLETATTLLASLVPSASVTADTTNRRLLISASETDHEKISRTLAQVTRDAGGEIPELQYYALQNAKGENAVTVLSGMLPAAQITFEPDAKRLSVVAVKRDHDVLTSTLQKLEAASPPDEKRTLKIYDVTASQRENFSALVTGLAEELPGLQLLTSAAADELAVWAKPTQHQIVADILAQLKRNIPAELRPKLIVYPVKQVDPTSISTVLTEIFPDVKITVDSVSSRLLIHAKPAQHETLKQAIEQLDSDVDGPREIKLMVYPADGLNAENVVQILAEDVPRAVVIQDATAKTLIVRAKLKDHERIASLLDTLRTASKPLADRSVVVYPSAHDDPASEKLFFSNAFPDATFLVDSASQSMTAFATASDHQKIQRAVSEKLKAQQDGAELRTYAIQDADQVSMSNILAAATDGARFVFSPKKLLAWASAEDHQRIQQVVQDMGNPAGSQSAAAFDVRKIGNASARQVLAELAPETTFLDGDGGKSLIGFVNDEQRTLIETALKQLAESPAAQQEGTLRFYNIGDAGRANAQSVLTNLLPAVTLTAIDNGQRLMGLVTETQHEKITTTLEQLRQQKPFAPDTELKLYSIKDLGTSATTVLTQAVPSASISAGATTDQIAVVATDADHEKLQAALDKLKAAKKIDNRELAVYDIRGTSPDAVQTVLQPFLDDDVQTTVDPTGRRLFVRATPDKQTLIKTTVESVMSGLQPDGKMQTLTYYVGPPNADEAQEVLQAMFPDATLVTDKDLKMIVATATAEQHETIARITEQFVSLGTLGQKPYPVVYQAQNLAAGDLENVIDDLYTSRDNVKVTANPKTGGVVAIATKDQHETIRGLIEKFDGAKIAGPKRELSVYRVAPLEAATVQSALETMVSKDVTISAPRRGSELLVSAPADEQKTIAKLIDQIVSPVGGAGAETKTYRLLRGEADEAQEVLTALFPSAVLVTDAGREVLVATATPEQHKTIDLVVKQMTGDVETKNGPIPKSYVLNSADGFTVLDVLEDLFARSSDVRVSLDEPNQTIVAIARPDQHASIASLLKELDPTEGAAVRKLKSYSLAELDGGMVNQVVSGVVREKDPGATVVMDGLTESLLITSNERGHEAANEAMARFVKLAPRETEIFQLAYLEPRQAQTAIDRLISSKTKHHSQRPQMHTDEDLQQLWVQAPAVQMESIRSLLVKMGETQLQTAATGREASTKNLRTIRVNNVNSALEQIEKLWPGLRKNPLKVIRPRTDRLKQIDGTLPSKDKGGQFSLPPEQVEPQQQPSSPLGDKQNPTPPTQAPGSTDQPPVVIIPGNGRLTIASDDVEALEQMESLLRVFFSGTPRGRNRDFAVYQIENTGAADVATTLQQIFADAEGLISFGQVAMVPDERLNALIVFASRSDRSRIEELISILDSEKTADTRRAYQTEIVPLQYASADRVEDVLQSVYKTQTAVGGSRASIAIPKGVPSEVAAVLRQINAASSSPLLTIEAQRETNSLIVKAPKNLLEEVTDLITRLDTANKTTRARGVTLIQLKKTNAARVMETLGDVLKSGGD